MKVPFQKSIQFSKKLKAEIPVELAVTRRVGRFFNKSSRSDQERDWYRSGSC